MIFLDLVLDRGFKLKYTIGPHNWEKMPLMIFFGLSLGQGSQLKFTIGPKIGKKGYNDFLDQVLDWGFKLKYTIGPHNGEKMPCGPQFHASTKFDTISIIGYTLLDKL